MGILLLALGYGLGYAFGNGIAGLVIALVVWAIMNLIAYFQGDSILLSMSRAIKIGPDDHPRLYNVVEEMKIASGLQKMPDVYIIDDPALNAFATGRDPNKASVAITSGLLEKLNRDELEGVIGHEMSHIKNRDVLLMTLCGVLLGTIVILAWYGSRALIFSGGGTRRSSRGGGQAQLIIFAVAIILMILAPIFAQLIYFAISRKREYLADASSSLYTRYPEGLASALEKIGASTYQLKTANQATAPMYISNPFRRQGGAPTDLTSTHPPIQERIRILRAMAGVSYADYERAYEQAHKGAVKGVIPTTALASAGAMELRAPRPEIVLEKPEPTRLERTREVGDLLWQKSGYKIITCNCGTRLKVPANLGRSTVTCPHCGRTHNI